LDNDLRIRLLLSAQRALLGAVTPNIRAVHCGMEEKFVFLQFTFDGDYSDEDRERCDIVATEVIANFYNEMIDTRYRIILPPARIPADEDSLLVYQRFEET
jgi:hypothetical protein